MKEVSLQKQWNKTKRDTSTTKHYRTRQEINEHIVWNHKRKWGYHYTNLKGLEKVNGEFALIMTIYNMKRTINILGFDKLMDKLKKWKPDYKKVQKTAEH
ncbi:MAG: transposase [Bacteroidetes bacterium]|nr:transposase [Bacteroidota bacterium]